MFRRLACLFSLIWLLPIPTVAAAPAHHLGQADLNRDQPSASTSVDTLCSSAKDDAGMAQCLWAITAQYRSAKWSRSAYQAAGLVHDLFEDILRSPVPCSTMINHVVATVTELSSRVSGRTLPVPRSCAEMAKLFRVMTTTNPQWMLCPVEPYSFTHLRKCIRASLDRVDAAQAVRHMLSALPDDSKAVSAQVSWYIQARERLTDALASTRKRMIHQVEQTERECRRDSGASRSDLTAALYARLATYGERDLSDQLRAESTRQAQVTCHDLIALSEAVEIPDPSIPPALAAERKCRLEAATLYEMGSKGQGVPWDRIDGPRAERACRKAVALIPDNTLLKLMLARGLIVNGKSGEAWPLLEAGISAGDPVALMLVHDIFNYGVSVSIDQKAAVALVASAAQKGNGAAQSVLGVRYYSGDGVERNTTTAAQWLEKAGDDRLPAATTVLGIMYFTGDGVRRDDNRAIKLFMSSRPYDCLANFYLAKATEESRGGFVFRGSPGERLNLQGQYKRIGLDASCPQEMRDIARAHAKILMSGPGGTLLGQEPNASEVSESDNLFTRSVLQAISVGRKAMAIEAWGRKTGLISDELEDMWGKAARRAEQEWIERDQVLINQCKENGYIGRGPLGCY